MSLSILNGQTLIAFMFFSILFFKSSLCSCSVLTTGPHTLGHPTLDNDQLITPSNMSKKTIDPITTGRKSAQHPGAAGKLCGVSFHSKPAGKSILTFEHTLQMLTTSAL